MVALAIASKPPILSMKFVLAVQGGVKQEGNGVVHLDFPRGDVARHDCKWEI